MAKRVKLGGVWRCECGADHEAGGVYLAAHWHEALVHACERCGRRHKLQAGVIELLPNGAGSKAAGSKAAGSNGAKAAGRGRPVQRVFKGRGEFQALRCARRWCEALGLSVGELQGPAPVGVLVGMWNIAKWRNLTAAQKAGLDGKLTAGGGSWRHGPVVLTLKAAAASRVGLDKQGRRVVRVRKGGGDHG